MENTKLNINQTLSAIQRELNAPKNLKNNFGGFTYRNVESIYEALKPYLAKYEVSVFITDSIEQVADRVYIKATASIINNAGDCIAVSAYAREALTKKGMDEAQITGSASSYARKYALGGLFLLDDNKDIDSQDNNQGEPKIQQSKAQSTPASKVADILKGAGLGMADIKAFMQAKGVTSADTEALNELLADPKSLIAEAGAFMASSVELG